MGRFGKKKEIEKNCVDAAKERIEYCFDNFDNVVVSFSGGKDSTACLNLALEIARHKKKLPLKVITFDEEAIPPETVEYQQRVCEIDDIDFDWYCVPIQHRNACSSKQQHWYPWAPEDKHKWVRDLPKTAITEYKGFKRDGIVDQVPRLFPGTQGTVASIMGIRTQESMTRYRTIASKRGAKAFMTPHPSKYIMNCYPIYDWTADDVWLAPKEFGWDYNRAYDVMTMAGMPLSLQRCCPPYGEQPIRGLWRFKTCWPELWGKMVDRVHGAATAARYANTGMYGCSIKDDDLPEGMTWQEYTMQTLSRLPDGAKKEVANVLKQCLGIHRSRSKNPMPESEPDPLSGFCWKTLSIAPKIGGDKFGRTSQKLTSKGLQERMKRGIHE